MSDTIKTTPKSRKIRPISINTGVAHVALGDMGTLMGSQIEPLLTNLEHQLLQDFVNPELIDWIVVQEVVVSARRLWKCAAREAENIDKEALWLNWLGKAERGFWKALAALHQLEKRNKKRAEADLIAQAERPDDFYEPTTVLNEERGGPVDLKGMTDAFTWCPPVPTLANLVESDSLTDEHLSGKHAMNLQNWVPGVESSSPQIDRPRSQDTAKDGHPIPAQPPQPAPGIVKPSIVGRVESARSLHPTPTSSPLPAGEVGRRPGEGRPPVAEQRKPAATEVPDASSRPPQPAPDIVKPAVDPRSDSTRPPQSDSRINPVPGPLNH